MRNILTIAVKEYKTYFVTAIGYVVMLIFFLIASYLFLEIALQAWQREATLRYLFQDMSIIMLFVVPLMTMRTLAEERSSNTIELLMTSPVREVEVVLGKYLGALGLYLTMLLFTLQYPLFLILYSNRQADVGPIVAGYIGAFLVGASFLAIGVFLSALTSSQIVAAVSTFGVLLLLWIVNITSYRVMGTTGEVLSYLAINRHIEDMVSGVIDLKDLIFFGSFIFVFLFLAVRFLASSRWR